MAYSADPRRHGDRQLTAAGSRPSRSAHAIARPRKPCRRHRLLRRSRSRPLEQEGALVHHAGGDGIDRSRRCTRSHSPATPVRVAREPEEGAIDVRAHPQKTTHRTMSIRRVATVVSLAAIAGMVNLTVRARPASAFSPTLAADAQPILDRLAGDIIPIDTAGLGGAEFDQLPQDLRSGIERQIEDDIASALSLERTSLGLPVLTASDHLSPRSSIGLLSSWYPIERSIQAVPSSVQHRRVMRVCRRSIAACSCDPATGPGHQSPTGEAVLLKGPDESVQVRSSSGS